MRTLNTCSWCHTAVKKPCTTVRECRTCSEPYTLTEEQAARVMEIVARHQPLRVKPLPIGGSR